MYLPKGLKNKMEQAPMKFFKWKKRMIYRHVFKITTKQIAFQKNVANRICVRLLMQKMKEIQSKRI